MLARLALMLLDIDVERRLLANHSPAHALQEAAEQAGAGLHRVRAPDGVHPGGDAGHDHAGGRDADRARDELRLYRLGVGFDLGVKLALPFGARFGDVTLAANTIDISNSVRPAPISPAMPSTSPFRTENETPSTTRFAAASTE